MKKPSRLFFFTFWGLLFATSVRAQETGFSLALGGGLETGLMGNPSVGAANAWGSGLLLDAFPGYRLDSKWTLGVDFGYRFVQQHTHSDRSTVNLSGKGWLLGPAARYQINDTWGVQASLDLLGHHSFNNSNAGDDNLFHPIGLRLKAQYNLQPNLTLDGLLSWVSWGVSNHRGITPPGRIMLTLIGVGATYTFDWSSPAKVVEPVVEKKTEAAPVAEKAVSDVFATERVDGNAKINLPSTSFASGQATLNPEIVSKLREAAVILSKNPNGKIAIKGYTDNTGNPKWNEKLSKDRAEAVKTILVEGGVSKENVQTAGMGDKDPIADNNTYEGRSKNRRVEISIEGEIR